MVTKSWKEKVGGGKGLKGRHIGTHKEMTLKKKKKKVHTKIRRKRWTHRGKEAQGQNITQGEGGSHRENERRGSTRPADEHSRSETKFAKECGKGSRWPDKKSEQHRTGETFKVVIKAVRSIG